jgi:hypothetical protein
MKHYSAEYHAPGWGASDAAQCTLRLFIDSAGCAAVAENPSGQLVRHLLVKAYPNGSRYGHDPAKELQEIWSNSEALHYSFARTTGVFGTPYATLIPRRLFDAARLPSYFQLLLRPEVKDLHYHAEPLPEFDCHLACAVPRSLFEAYTKRFPQGTPTHLSAALLRYWLRLAPAQETGVFVNLRWDTLQIGIYERRHLLFYNSFKIGHPEDLLYYALLGFEQFRLDPQQVPLHCSGHLDPQTDRYQALARCFRHIRFVSLPETVRLPAVLQSFPGHRFLDLFCGAYQNL